MPAAMVAAKCVDGDHRMTVRVRDMVYGLITVFNILPVFLYCSKVHIDYQETPEFHGPVWMIWSALSMIFVINLMSAVQIPFMSRQHQIYVVVVPLIISSCYALTAAILKSRQLETRYPKRRIYMNLHLRRIFNFVRFCKS